MADDVGAAPPPSERRTRRVTLLVALACLIVVGVMLAIAWDLSGPRNINRYGDWALMDQLWDSCEYGDPVACDNLFVNSPPGSEYEDFGRTCGRRFPGATVECTDLMPEFGDSESP